MKKNCSYDHDESQLTGDYGGIMGHFGHENEEVNMSNTSLFATIAKLRDALKATDAHIAALTMEVAAKDKIIADGRKTIGTLRELAAEQAAAKDKVIAALTKENATLRDALKATDANVTDE